MFFLEFSLNFTSVEYILQQSWQLFGLKQVKYHCTYHALKLTWDAESKKIGRKVNCELWCKLIVNLNFNLYPNIRIYLENTLTNYRFILNNFRKQNMKLQNLLLFLGIITLFAHLATASKEIKPIDVTISNVSKFTQKKLLIYRIRTWETIAGAITQQKIAVLILHTVQFVALLKQLFAVLQYAIHPDCK